MLALVPARFSGNGIHGHREAVMRVLYLTHDVSDPATARRVRMLQSGGARVRVMGFRRGSTTSATIAGSPTTDLGRTHNGRFAHRTATVLRSVADARRHVEAFAWADVVVARNLEMLAIAVRGRGLCVRPPGLVYECLDVHRLLLRRGGVGRALRELEGWLARHASLLITSSPGFVREYFEPLSRVRLPVLLVENKVFNPEPQPQRASAPRRLGPPWRIGWFGSIRCRRSLDLLCAVARANPQLVEVVIRGKPAYDQFEDFDAQVAHAPGVTFLGSYRNPEDLGSIYGDVHFSWTIDMFEEGLNSTWLLPNRLYEGGLFGAVPIAADGVETSRFIRSFAIGHSLVEPKLEALTHFLHGLTPSRYEAMQSAVTAVATDAWECRREDCSALVRRLDAVRTEAASRFLERS